MLDHQQVSRTLLDFVEIRYAGALRGAFWVRSAMIKAENDWRDGPPQEGHAAL